MGIQKPGNIKIFDSLMFEVVLLLYAFPMKENKYKIYQKLEPNAKMGMLASHLKSTARYCGISKQFIQMFEEAQNHYKFYKGSSDKWINDSMDDMRNCKFTEEGGSAKFLGAHKDYVKMEYKMKMAVMDLGYITKKMFDAVLKSDEANIRFKELKAKEEEKS